MYADHLQARVTQRPGAHAGCPAAARQRPGHRAAVIMRVATGRRATRDSGSPEPAPPAVDRPTAGATGQQTGDLVSDLYQCYASLDPAGNYLLVQFPTPVPNTSGGWVRPTILNLRTGQLTSIHAPAYYGPFTIAW